MSRIINVILICSCPQPMETLQLTDHLERLKPKIGFMSGKRLPISSNLDYKLLEQKIRPPQLME